MNALINWLAGLLLPRLRRVDTKRLRALKAELAQFNSRTGEWKHG